MRLIRGLRAVVERYPFKTAVEDDRESLTYEHLWTQAEELSRQLSSPHSHYVLIQEARSCRLLVRLLAVWMAGHAPLMLDLQTPRRRLDEVLRQVKPLAFFQGESINDYETSLSARGVEYLVATSGSTGRPKMVMVGEGSLVPMLRSQIEAFQLDAESTVLWMLSPGFDASFSDIGTALLSGAKLLCGSQGVARELPRVLREQVVTHLDIPPSLLARFRPGEFPESLRCLVVGGEPSRAETLRAWSKFHRVVAVYGPSETTVCASLSVVDEHWDRAYLGRPLPGVEFATEDEELLIGGPQVALGYLGQESAAFHLRDGKAWYRSGDLVSPDPHPLHGFEFKSRLDRQVKVRGQRLELQEIESRASQTLSHNDVAVVLKNRRLLLYWKQGPDPLAEELELRRALSESLAPSFIPCEYRALTTFPRGASGKVDREALPDLQCLAELDSLELISLSLEIERQGVDLGQRDFRGAPLANLRSLVDIFSPSGPASATTGGTPASLIDCSSITLSTDFLRLEAESLAQDMKASGPTAERSANTSPKVGAKRSKPRLLVTGLGGNLGRALEPLLREDFEVWDLSRSRSGPSTLQGDLTLAQFGLDPEEWEFLQGGIDQVLHLAALLDLSKSYSQLKAINVTCLSALSQISGQVHFASTMAVTLSAVPPSLKTEGSQTSVYGGYAQSKWVADRAMTLANLPGLTFRYGHLLGTPGTDLLSTVIRGLRDLGCCPRVDREKPLSFDVTPMDWAAKETSRHLRQGTGARSLLQMRRGWKAHFQDLAELMKGLGLGEQIESEEFFTLKPPTRSAALAIRALWKCRPGPSVAGAKLGSSLGEQTSNGQVAFRPDFDLFLLGNLGQSTESGPVGTQAPLPCVYGTRKAECPQLPAIHCLESYLTAVLESELPEAHREYPAEAPDESPTLPSS